MCRWFAGLPFSTWLLLFRVCEPDAESWTLVITGVRCGDETDFGFGGKSNFVKGLTKKMEK